MKEIFVVAVLAVVLIPTASAQTVEEANETLGRASGAIQEMEEDGMPTTRVEDLMEQANNTYRAQLAAERRNETADYSLVVELSNEIIDIKDQAFMTHDQLEALGDRIDELEEDYNVSGARSAYEEGRQEFEDQRFEKAQENIDEAYKEISEAQALGARAEAFLEAQRDNIVYFITDNWLWLLIGGGIAAFVGWIGKREWRYYRLKKEREKLKLRRGVLQDLLKEAQSKYFQDSEMAESTYNIRTDKYGEMIRDVNSRIPVINEELEKVGSWFQD